MDLLRKILSIFGISEEVQVDYMHVMPSNLIRSVDGSVVYVMFDVPVKGISHVLRKVIAVTTKLSTDEAACEHLSLEINRQLNSGFMSFTGVGMRPLDKRSFHDKLIFSS